MRLIIALIVFLAGVSSACAQALPYHADPSAREILPDLGPVPAIRFLTTADFPPFNFRALALFALLLVGLPLLALATDNHAIDLFDAFYRTGALVFGGGHVVLPLLQAETVPSGWIGDPAFLAGYGAVQAMPGPLFTFAAYLGAAMTPWPNGWIGAALCLVAIFLPSALLVTGAMPFWNQLRAKPMARAMLRGVNAAVVGLLLAAFYDPVWTAGVTSAADFGLAAAAFLLLMLWRTPPWLVVILCAIGGALLGLL